MEAAFLAEFGFQNRVEGLTTAGRTDRAIARDLFGLFGMEVTDDSLKRFISAYLRHLPDHLTSRGGMVLPGIAALLNALSTRDDVVLGLLTGNLREGARIKLGHYGLYDYFKFGGYGDDHLERDDVARLAYTEVCNRHGECIDLERLWVIGDTPADVQCARAIGAKIVAVATGSYKLKDLEATRPDHLFADFSDPDVFINLLG